MEPCRKIHTLARIILKRYGYNIIELDNGVLDLEITYPHNKAGNLRMLRCVMEKYKIRRTILGIYELNNISNLLTFLSVLKRKTDVTNIIIGRSSMREDEIIQVFMIMWDQPFTAEISVSWRKRTEVIHRCILMFIEQKHIYVDMISLQLNSTQRAEVFLAYVLSSEAYLQNGTGRSDALTAEALMRCRFSCDSGGSMMNGGWIEVLGVCKRDTKIRRVVIEMVDTLNVCIHFFNTHNYDALQKMYDIGVDVIEVVKMISLDYEVRISRRLRSGIRRDQWCFLMYMEENETHKN